MTAATATGTTTRTGGTPGSTAEVDQPGDEALGPPPLAHAAEGEFEALRLCWLDLQLGTGFDAGAEPYASRLAETGALARAFRASMAPTDTSLWPGDPFDPPSGITRSYSRLWTMTQAYVQPGTGLTGDATLLADILRGLDHLSARIYKAGAQRYGNWWEGQIGSPRLLMDIVAALHPHLGPERIAAACAAVDHFVPDTMRTNYTGTSTGANRVDLCRSVALRGILDADRPAHLGRLLGHVRAGHARRPGPPLRPARGLRLGRDRPDGRSSSTASNTPTRP